MQNPKWINRPISKLFLMDESPKPKTQCSCKQENDDTDFGMFKSVLAGTKLAAIITPCHKCGKLRVSLKQSDPRRLQQWILTICQKSMTTSTGNNCIGVYSKAGSSGTTEPRTANSLLYPHRLEEERSKRCGFMFTAHTENLMGWKIVNFTAF